MYVPRPSSSKYGNTCNHSRTGKCNHTLRWPAPLAAPTPRVPSREPALPTGWQSSFPATASFGATVSWEDTGGGSIESACSLIGKGLSVQEPCAAPELQQHWDVLCRIVRQHWKDCRR